MEVFKARLNQAPDPRAPFLDPDSFVYVADKLSAFDAATGAGTLAWTRHRRKSRVAFDHMSFPLEAVESWEFPAVYGEPKELPFALSFVSERTVRLRLRATPGALPAGPSLMVPEAVPDGSSAWRREEVPGGFAWRSAAGRIVLRLDPWTVELSDAAGHALTRTVHLKNAVCMINSRPVPTSFAVRAGDLDRTIAATLALAPAEKLFGCGESFTRLDKRGQTVALWTQDSHGSLTGEMYKPVPFYLSSRGYGVFVHGSTPMAFDFGESYDAAQVLYTGDDSLDLFFFLGVPTEVLTEYTALTGRSPRPPLWSFGLWMSRITYDRETQVREVAAKLREHRVPCDVIHLDTGWFEHDWRCDYRFSPSRFPDAPGMIKDLKRDGFHVSLWQLPYFTPPNPLFPEIVANGLAVRAPGGGLPGEDAVLDFSNPATVAWYQEKLAGLLKLGVGAIKVDFGEAAPLNGLYASGRTGWQEHNLYPLRYNQAAAEVTRRVTGEAIIWARSAWAGSQRYPLHWGGDAEATDAGMLGTLRGGLSFGLSGFSYWSHDAGGFFPATPKALYRRWLPFTLLSSHARCHGQPPTEPWEFGEEFTDLFRRATELRYSLLPYLWAQAAECSRLGHPLLRPLFFGFQEDPGAWLIEDEYLLGSDLLVAPLFDESGARDVYLPPGGWTDVQTGAAHRDPGWAQLKAGPVPVVLLARDGAAIPRAAVAQHTGAVDWNTLTLEAYGQADAYRALVSLPDTPDAATLVVRRDGPRLTIAADPLGGRVTWKLVSKP